MLRDLGAGLGSPVTTSTTRDTTRSRVRIGSPWPLKTEGGDFVGRGGRCWHPQGHTRKRNLGRPGDGRQKSTTEHGRRRPCGALPGTGVVHQPANRSPVLAKEHSPLWAAVARCKYAALGTEVRGGPSWTQPEGASGHRVRFPFYDPGPKETKDTRS